MEEHLGRKLTSIEVVHHIDGDKSNNDIKNLKLFPNKSEHTKYHSDNGDINRLNGEEPRKLINGKLKCSRCGKLKELKEFIKEKHRLFGVRGVCKQCKNIKYKKQKENEKTNKETE